MICNECKNEYESKDFYNSDVCYRCIYKRKTRLTDKEYKMIRSCKICNCPVPKGKDIYCSDKCAYQAKLKKDSEYWVRKCVAPKINWKN